MTLQNTADNVNANASQVARKLDRTSTATQILMEAERRGIKFSTILAELESGVIA